MFPLVSLPIRAGPATIGKGAEQRRIAGHIAQALGQAVDSVIVGLRFSSRDAVGGHVAVRAAL